MTESAPEDTKSLKEKGLAGLTAASSSISQRTVTIALSKWGNMIWRKLIFGAASLVCFHFDANASSQVIRDLEAIKLECESLKHQADTITDHKGKRAALQRASECGDRWMRAEVAVRYTHPPTVQGWEKCRDLDWEFLREAFFTQAKRDRYENLLRQSELALQSAKDTATVLRNSSQAFELRRAADELYFSFEKYHAANRCWSFIQGRPQ